MKYLSSGSLVDTWGKGNFLAINFNSDDWTQYDSVKVGLDPSMTSGLVELINDPDKNGVFKVTDKDAQNLVIVCTKDGASSTFQYDLSKLKLNAAV